MGDERVAAWRPLGAALLDFHQGRRRRVFTVHSNLWADERVQAEEYYRPLWRRLPPLEVAALELCCGRVLDAGAGAGRHALELQERGLEVTALDFVPEMVQIMTERGVRDARCGNLFTTELGRFDTIVLLMHGLGVVRDRLGLAALLARLPQLLAPGGQVVFDSADLRRDLDARERRIAESLLPPGRYLGEVEFQLTYRELEGEPYLWLYAEPELVAAAAAPAGFTLEVLDEGKRGAYLGRLTRP